MAVDVLETRLCTITGNLPGHATSTCKFRFKGVNTGNSHDSTKTANLANGVATCKWSAPRVSDNVPYDEYVCEVSGDADLAPDRIEIHVWRASVRVRAKDQDGAWVDGARFGVSAGAGQPAYTTTTGEAWRDQAVDTPGAVSIAWDAPYQLLNTKSDYRTFEATIQLKSRVSITRPASPVKQYVNLKTEPGKPNQGPAVEVEVEDDETGEGAQSFYVEVEFDPANSRRTTPEPKLVGGFKDKALWKGHFKFDGGTRKTFSVQVGLAGGDKTTVRVGGTKACTDATLTIVNWRKVYYQLTCPEGYDRYPADLPDGTKVIVARELGDAKAFIEVVKHDANTITADELTGSKLAAEVPGPWIVADGSRDGQTAFLLNVADSRALTEAFKPYNTLAPDAPGVHVTLCDELYLRGNDGDKTVSQTTESVDAVIRLGSPSRHLFTETLGLTGRRRGPVSAITCVQWKPVQGIPEAHPLLAGLASKQRLLGNLYEELQPGQYTTSDEHLQSFNLRIVSLSTAMDVLTGQRPCPNVAAIGPQAATTWPIEILVSYQWADRTKAAMAAGKFLVCKLPDSEEGTARLAQLFLHELGHAMKQTRVPTSRKPRATDEVIPETHYGDPPPGVAEHPSTYAGRGHVGPHCHAGVALKDSFTGENGTCVMFGATQSNVFCADCLRLLKAIDLRTLKGDPGAEL